MVSALGNPEIVQDSCCEEAEIEGNHNGCNWALEKLREKIINNK